MQSVSGAGIEAAASRRSTARWEHTACRFLEVTVAAAFRVPVEEMRATTRRRARVAFARQVAMYVAHVGLGFSLTAVGREFSRDRTTAAHACRVVEDLRDDPQVDATLDYLESAAIVWRRHFGPGGDGVSHVGAAV